MPSPTSATTCYPGEILGIVGESGSGKSVSVMSVLGLIPQPPGRIAQGEALFKGEDLLKMPKRRLREIRGGEMAMIFQDPMTSLNPVLTIGRPDRRGDPGSQPWDVRCRGREEDDRAPRARRRSFCRAAGEAVSTRVLRRHAAARDDRDGNREQPERPDRRRADDRARRDDPGTDRRGAEGRAERDARRDDPHHPRPRAHRGARRPRRRHVRRASRRAQRRVRDVQAARASLHGRPHEQPAQGGHRSGAGSSRFPASRPAWSIVHRDARFIRAASCRKGARSAGAMYHRSGRLPEARPPRTPPRVTSRRS